MLPVGAEVKKISEFILCIKKVYRLKWQNGLIAKSNRLIYMFGKGCTKDKSLISQEESASQLLRDD